MSEAFSITVTSPAAKRTCPRRREEWSFSKRAGPPCPSHIDDLPPPVSLLRQGTRRSISGCARPDARIPPHRSVLGRRRGGHSAGGVLSPKHARANPLFASRSGSCSPRIASRLFSSLRSLRRELVDASRFPFSRWLGGDSMGRIATRFVVLPGAVGGRGACAWQRGVAGGTVRNRPLALGMVV